MRVQGAITLNRGARGPGAPRGGAGFGSVQGRDRKGFATYYSLGDTVGRRINGQRFFTTNELYSIYQLTPDVRACVDKIRLRIANNGWLVIPTMKKSEPGYERAYRVGEAVAAFLAKPNTDEDWTNFIGKWTQDVLLYDAGVVEKCRSTKGKLQELVCWRGGDFTPLQDEHGHVYQYRQDMAVQGPVRFIPEDLDYVNVFANTTFPNGQPLLESLIEEFITMRASASHLRRAVDADEIPPGILALIGVTDRALKRFEGQMQASAGRDDRLKIVGIEEGNGKVDWIQLRRSMKDLDWMPNIKEVRRTIYRIFHMAPVVMGDTENVPRASAEVQVEITDSGLVGPLERRIEALVNARWIPAILGNPDLAKLVKFAFDPTLRLSEADQKIRMERLSQGVLAEIITKNEAREELGLDPLDLVENADTTGGKDDNKEPTKKDPAAEDDGTDDGEDVAASNPRRPGVIRWAPGVLRGLGPVAIRAGTLPSDWQPTGRFRGSRSLPLRALGDVVAAYADTVTPLYELCARNVLRAATQAVQDGVLTATEAAAVAGAVGRETDALYRAWSTETTRHYEDAARMGAETAEDWGAPATTWKSTAATYQARAIGYLNATGTSPGLIATLRASLTDLIVQAVRRAPVPSATRAETLPAALAAFLESIRRVFEANQYRIQNWSGRLVELAHGTLTEGLRAQDAQGATDPVSEDADPWYVEWVEVADAATCSTCRQEGARPFHPLSDQRIMPGGATDCQARCRCVLVFWRKSEVDSGKAKRLGPVRAMRWDGPSR